MDEKPAGGKNELDEARSKKGRTDRGNRIDQINKAISQIDDAGLKALASAAKSFAADYPRVKQNAEIISMMEWRIRNVQTV
jgi:hypothetical protein